MCLDRIEDSIFVDNTPIYTFKCLFLNEKYLERFINSEGAIGWLEDLMFTFFTTLLNFWVEYNIENKNWVMLYLLVCLQIRKIMWWKWILASILTPSKFLCRTLVNKKDTSNITKKMNDWYHNHTSSNIDRILSVFQENKQMLSYIVIPIRNDNYFWCLTSFFPVI